MARKTIMGILTLMALLWCGTAMAQDDIPATQGKLKLVTPKRNAVNLGKGPATTATTASKSRPNTTAGASKRKGLVLKKSPIQSSSSGSRTNVSPAKRRAVNLGKGSDAMNKIKRSGIRLKQSPLSTAGSASTTRPNTISNSNKRKAITLKKSPITTGATATQSRPNTVSNAAKRKGIRLNSKGPATTATSASQSRPANKRISSMTSNGSKASTVLTRQPMQSSSNRPKPTRLKTSSAKPKSSFKPKSKLNSKMKGGKMLGAVGGIAVGGSAINEFAKAKELRKKGKISKTQQAKMNATTGVKAAGAIAKIKKFTPGGAILNDVVGTDPISLGVEGIGDLINGTDNAKQSLKGVKDSWNRSLTKQTFTDPKAAAKRVGKGTVKGLETIGRNTIKAGKFVGDNAKKTGKSIKKGATKFGNSVKSNAKKATSSFKSNAKKTGNKVKKFLKNPFKKKKKKKKK